MTATPTAPPAIRRTWKGIWEVPLAIRNILWQGGGDFPGCGFAPNEHQSAILCSPERIKLITGGERSGKSYITAAEAYIWLWQLGKDDVLWIVGPDYTQAQPEFGYLRQMMEKAGLLHATAHVATPRIGSWSMFTRPGTMIVTKSAADPQTLAGVPPAGVLMVECAQQSNESFFRLMGRVAQKRAPLLMSGTFEGSLGWMPEVWRKWKAQNEDGAKAFALPTWTNTALFPGGRQDPEILRLEKIYPESYFKERLGGEPSPPSRLVMREFDLERHVRLSAEFDPSKKVQLWIDPGYQSPYAILAAHVDADPRRVVIFDEIYEKGQLARDLIDMVKARPWWPNVSVLVLDKASKQHLGNESQAEIWVQATRKRAVMGLVPIQDGILLHRSFLMNDDTGTPKMLIHPRCKNTISEHGLYMYAQDGEGRPANEIPIDKFNHAIKAIVYGLCANYGLVGRHIRQRVSVRY